MLSYLHFFICWISCRNLEKKGVTSVRHYLHSSSSPLYWYTSSLLSFFSLLWGRVASLITNQMIAHEENWLFVLSELKILRCIETDKYAKLYVQSKHYSCLYDFWLLTHFFYCSPFSLFFLVLFLKLSILLLSASLSLLIYSICNVPIFLVPASLTLLNCNL